jgi:hypothetical protein
VFEQVIMWITNLIIFLQIGAPISVTEAPGTKDPSQQARSKVLRGSIEQRNSEIMSKNKKQSPVKWPIVQKSKFGIFCPYFLTCSLVAFHHFFST